MDRRDYVSGVSCNQRGGFGPDADRLSVMSYRHSAVGDGGVLGQYPVSGCLNLIRSPEAMPVTRDQTRGVAR